MPEPEAVPELTQRLRRWAAELRTVPTDDAKAVAQRLAGEIQDELIRVQRGTDARTTALHRLCPAGVVLTDAGGAIFGANPAFLRLTGATSEDSLIGTDVVSLGVSGQDRAVLSEALGGRAAAQPAESSSGGQVVVVRPPSTAAPARLTVSALPGGRAHRPMLLFEDAGDPAVDPPTTLSVDPLTGLADPDQLGVHLDAAVAASASGRAALVYLDLDGFSVIRNGPGPEAGDLVLRSAADTLRAVFAGQRSFLTRIGGDRFAVVLHGGFVAGEVVALAEDAIARLSAPVHLADGTGVGVSASAGVMVTGTAAVSGADLTRAAELALQRAKELGRARCVLFDPVQGRATRDRYLRASSIAGALQDGEISVVYRPHVVLPDAAVVVSLNATLRWDHARLGRLRAPEFYPLAERTGMTIPLGRYLLAEALRTRADWQARFGDNAPTVCLTLPRRMAVDADLVGMVRTELARNGLAPQHLMLCTEAPSLLDERGDLLQAVQRLARLGLVFVVDITGPTELEMLPALGVPAPGVMLTGPIVDVLDVEDPPEWAQRNVRQVVERAEELGIRVGAHGVRAPAHAELLHGLGVLVAAGPYLPEHVTAADAERWVGHAYPTG